MQKYAGDLVLLCDYRNQRLSRTLLGHQDKNIYTLGKVGKQNVVIAVLPEGGYGTSSAAKVGSDVLHSFPNVRIGLMVGIGGGAPSRKHDIRLGDVVVSAPHSGKGGVFQYDFGKTIQDQSFRPTGFLNQPPVLLRAAMNDLKAQYEREGHQIEETINNILENKPILRTKYKQPDPSSDKLYQSRVVHPTNDEVSCTAVMNPPNGVWVRMHFGKFGWESDWKWGRKVRALIHFLIKWLWRWEWSLKGR